MSSKELSSEFISARIFETQSLIARLREISETNSQEILEAKPGEGKWSVAQVLEHLNHYNRYYLAAIKNQLIKYPDGKSQPFYKPGWLGAYFTRLMDPAGARKKKMQSPKNYSPSSAPDCEREITEFICGEETLLMLLEKSRNKNLMNIRVPISLNRFIRLQLGDTFHFLVAHQQRHFLQIQEILDSVHPKLSKTRN